MNNYPLKTLFWECTLRCNAYCAFCGSRRGDVHGEELSTQAILSAFRDIAAKLEPKSIMIHVTGGEPLLRGDLFEVMTACTEMGFSWGMVTNGMLITPDVISRMRKAGMKTISVSLDGLKETHEALRGVKGSFDKALANLKLLRDAHFLEHLQVTTVVSKRNIGELEALHALLRPLGLDSWRVALVDPIGRAQDQTELLLGKAEIQRYLDFIRSHQGDPELPVITSCSHYYAEEGKSLGRNEFVCNAGKTVASILAGGDIFVCPNVPRRPELIQGNVLRDSLPEVWRRGFRQFRDPSYREGTSCAKCPDWAECQGDSAHTWDYDRGEPKFCYRQHFPETRGQELPALADVTASIRKTVPRLRGIHLRYGWGNGIPVVFTPNAARELHHYFHWGQRHPQNLSELMAALVGHKLRDALLVEFVSPVFLAKRNTAEALFTSESLESGRMEADAVNLSYFKCTELRLMDTPCELLGFVHSHPDELDLFLSEGDVYLHRQLSEENIRLSVIVNPQKRQIAAFCGKEPKPAEVRILSDEKDLPDWNIAPF